MSYRRVVCAVSVIVALGGAAPGCTVGSHPPPAFDTSIPADTGRVDAASDTNPSNDSGFDVGPPRPDVGPIDAFLTADAACESATSEATLTRSPADIIWVIDNSSSMRTAIDAVRTGINGFAAQLVASDLDYRMIMLALRRSNFTCTTSTDCASHAGLTVCDAGYCVPTGRYPICVPEPLAGPNCADGPNFFQLEVDIKSTKPVEQILGTLAQSAGYTSGSDGGPPWRDLLRPGATRTFVLVSDDNSRTCAHPVGTCLATDPPLTELSLEDFPGGGDPFNSTTLGPGILDPSYGGLFDGYTFDAVYGYGSDTDPSVLCTFPDGSHPSSPGYTYTTLVQHTGGVRAQICDGAAAFPPFFDAIAASVVHGAPIECTVTIPPAPVGMTFQAGRVNVIIRTTTDQTYIPHVTDVAHCGATRGGWYYDDNGTPMNIVLCPTSCDDARGQVVGPGTGLDVQFGCQSILM